MPYSIRIGFGFWLSLVEDITKTILVCFYGTQCTCKLFHSFMIYLEELSVIKLISIFVTLVIVGCQLTTVSILCYSTVNNYIMLCSNIKVPVLFATVFCVRIFRLKIIFNILNVLSYNFSRNSDSVTVVMSGLTQFFIF